VLKFSKLLSHTLTCLLLSSSAGAASRPLWIAGQPTKPIIETKMLDSGLEGLPVWVLPRVGVQIANDPESLELRYESKTLFFVYGIGWEGNFGFSADLPVPEIYKGSLHVSVQVLREMGLPLRENDTAFEVNPAARAPQLTALRRSVANEDGLEVSRLVLEFSDPFEFELDKVPQKINIRLSKVQKLASDVLPTLELPGEGTLRYKLKDLGQDTLFTLETKDGAATEIFTLENPFRIVLDTRVNLEPVISAPDPGLERKDLGLLHLLVFDPERYMPQIATAPTGSSRAVGQFVGDHQAVAGVNGGYFDPASSMAVDLVAVNGRMLSSSLERRATLGILKDGGLLWGIPKPRYLLGSGKDKTRVNTLSAKTNPNWLTLFVGDGKTPVGADGFSTLYIKANKVAKKTDQPSTPAPGEVTVSFKPERFPQLPLSSGESLTLGLEWFSQDWQEVQDALSAGPMLLQGGQYVLSPAQEGFNTAGSIWRRTRQVAFGTFADGRLVIAYHEWATPEEFAYGLLKSGLQTAMRLDSGSSASVFVQGHYLNHGGKRKVPNAIVLVPRERLVAGKD
jgi:hypothetical protein